MKEDMKVRADKIRESLNKVFQGLKPFYSILKVFALILSILVGYIAVSNYFLSDNQDKNKPFELYGEAECGIFTSKAFQKFQASEFPDKEKLGYTFSLNKSNDYYIDIFYLKVEKGFVNKPLMKVVLPIDLIPSYFKSLPDDRSSLTLQDNRFGVRNMAIIASWPIEVPEGDIKKLIIFYNISREDERLLVTGDRTYTYTAGGGSFQKEPKSLNCSNGWVYFYDFKFSSE